MALKPSRALHRDRLVRCAVRLSSVAVTVIAGPLCGALALAGCCHGPRQPQCLSTTVTTGGEAPRPEALRTVVHATHPHAADAYTEGLFWRDGALYEGTGLEHRSEVRRLPIETGIPAARWRTPDDRFGEGIAMRGDEVYELTWDARVAFVWDAHHGTLSRQIPMDDFGWGLSYDPRSDLFIASDGSATLTWRRSDDLAPVRTVTVVREARTVCNLNELEVVGDVVWVNVYGSTEHEILRVDLSTGHVTGVADLSALTIANHAGADRELNGIAWIPERQRFLVTGKRWEHLYEVTFEPAIGGGDQPRR